MTNKRDITPAQRRAIRTSRKAQGVFSGDNEVRKDYRYTRRVSRKGAN